MRLNWQADADLARRVEQMLASGERARRHGDVLVMDFAASTTIPTSAAVADLLGRLESELIHGARKLVLIARGPKVVHVKMRGLDESVNFDRVLGDVRALKLGGGGRGGAASLYAPAGRVRSEVQIERDVRWLIDRL